jgi:hydrocephalus-inducing protein
MNDLNFGALLMNSKKTRTFTIENRGEKFDLKYTITKMNRDETKRLGQDMTNKKG